MVGLRDPFSSDLADEVAVLPLTDCGVSTSMAFSDPVGRSAKNHQGAQPNGAHQGQSDIVQPRVTRPFKQRAIEQQAACSVITPTALDAEVLSTALLAMGKARASKYLDSSESRLPSRCCVAWLERREDKTALEWLKGSPHEFESR